MTIKHRVEIVWGLDDPPAEMLGDIEHWNGNVISFKRDAGNPDCAAVVVEFNDPRNARCYALDEYGTPDSDGTDFAARNTYEVDDGLPS